MPDELAIIREELESNLSWAMAGNNGIADARAGLAAFDALEGRILPALPSGYHLVGLQEGILHHTHWFAIVSGPGFSGGCKGRGATPRAAVLAALAQIPTP